MGIALAALAALLLQDPPLFQEKFGEKLSDGWTWVREEAGAWKLDGGALRIKTLPGTIWFRANTAKNILLRKPPAPPTDAEPLAIEVTVESKPEANAEQAGLLVYVDDGNYAKLVREALKGKTHAVFAREAKGIPVSHPPKEDGADAFQFKIVWAAARLSGFYRPAAGGDWVHLGDYDVPPGENPQIGLCAHGGAAESDRWASFKGFRVVKGAK
jgi:hypothetical protein